MRRVQYIGARGKAKFWHKMNCVNRLTYYLNRFKPNKTREYYDEEWNVSSDNWVDSNSPEGVWYDSKQVWIDSDHVREFISDFLWIDSRKLCIDSLWIYSGELWIDSMRYYSGKLWINSLQYYLGKFDLIQKGVTQGKWTKRMLYKNQWIMNRIKKFTKGFSIYDNTRDIQESHDTMRHDLLGCFNKFLS